MPVFQGYVVIRGLPYPCEVDAPTQAAAQAAFAGTSVTVEKGLATGEAVVAPLPAIRQSPVPKGH